MSISFRFSYYITHSFSCKTFTQGKGRHILDKELHFSVHGSNSPTGKTTFFSYLFFILIHTIHPDKSFSSLYSSQQPPTTFSFPKSTAPPFPLRKEQTFQRNQASIAYQAPITVGISPYIKAGQDNPVERIQRDAKESYIPFPMWGVVQIPQAQQPLHVCRGLLTHQCRRQISIKCD